MTSSTQITPSFGARITRILSQNGLLIALVVIVAFFSILRPETFLTTGNIGSILQANSPIAFMALGLMIPLIVGHFDLSIAAVAAFSGIFATGLMANQDVAWPLALVIAVGVAALIGAVNGYLVTYAKLNSLVVTLATQSVLFGMILLYSQGSVIYAGIPPEFTQLGQSRPFGVPLPFFFVVLAAIVLWFFLYFRPTGRRLYAIGGGEDAARLMGIRVDRSVLGAFMVGSVLAALGGFLQVAQLGAATPTSGAEYLLPAIAACFLGETSIRRGFYNVWGTVVAVFLVAVGTTGLFMLGAQNWVQPVFHGVVLIGAVILGKLSNRASSRRS